MGRSRATPTPSPACSYTSRRSCCTTSATAAAACGPSPTTCCSSISSRGRPAGEQFCQDILELCNLGRSQWSTLFGLFARILSFVSGECRSAADHSVQAEHHQQHEHHPAHHQCHQHAQHDGWQQLISLYMRKRNNKS